MQPTENNSDPRSETDALIDELRAFSRAETMQGMTLTGDRYARAAVALAAERDRADRAEAKLTTALEIADVWIDSEPSDPAPISVVTAGRVFRGLLTSEATA